VVAPTLLRPRKHSVVELSLRGSGLFFLGLPPAAMPLSSSQPRRVPVQFCQTWACKYPSSIILPRAKCSGGTAVRTDFFSRWRRRTINSVFIYHTKSHPCLPSRISRQSLAEGDERVSGFVGMVSDVVGEALAATHRSYASELVGPNGRTR
jgi:hypothetical protein